MPLENVQNKRFKNKNLDFSSFIVRFRSTGQNSAKIQKKTHLGELHDPFTKNFTIVLTIMVAGWDVRLLTSNFCSVFINLIKFAFFYKIGGLGGVSAIGLTKSCLIFPLGG